MDLPRTDNVDDVRKSMLKLLDDTIESCIPFYEKSGYLEAQIKCPQLILIETDPLMFLRYEGYNVWAAAQRIVKYWEWKRVGFGEHRAFLSLMDLSGSGAMSDTDLSYIYTGVATVLPDDDQGNTVMFFDRYRMENPTWDEIDVMERLRITFFSFYLAAYNFHTRIERTTATPIATTTLTSQYLKLGTNINNGSNDDYGNDKEGTGLVALMLVHSFVPRPSRNFKDFVLEAMPIKVVRSYVLFHPPPGRKYDMFTVSQYFFPAFFAAFSPLLKFLNVHPISVSAPNDIAWNLVQQFGFQFDCLPNKIGGFWDSDTYFQWLRTVASVTQCRLALFDTGDDLVATGTSNSRKIRSSVSSCETSPTSYTAITPTSLCCHSISVNEIVTRNKLEYQEHNHEHSSNAGTIRVKDVLGKKQQQLYDTSDIVPFLVSDEFFTAQDLEETAMFCDDDHNCQSEMPKKLFCFESDNLAASAVVSQIHKTGTIVVPPTNALSPNPSDDGTSVVPKRTSSYWTLRKELYGDDRYKFPMNQIGTGVLNDKDTAALALGYLSFLPNNIKGQHVLAYDSSKCVQHDGDGLCSFRTQRRLLFYLIDSLLVAKHTKDGCGNDKLQLVLLCFVDETVARDDPVPSESFNDILNVFTTQHECLLEVVCVHVFLQPVGLGWFTYQANAKVKVQSWFDPATYRIDYHTLPSTFDDEESTVIPIDDGEQDLCEAFSIVFGFDRINLPEWMGGGWTVERFQRDCRERIEQEWAIQNAQGTRNETM